MPEPKSTACRTTGKAGKAQGRGKGQKEQKGTQERQERRKRSEMIKGLKPIRINFAKGTTDQGVELFCFLEYFDSINQ